MATAEETEQKCTCGSCADGWLSPRMKERLEGEADFLHYVSSSLVEDVANDIAADKPMPEWCIAADPALHYIPTDLKDKMTPLFYRGYMLVMETIMQILLVERVAEDNEPSRSSPSFVPTLTVVSEQLEQMQAQAAELDESLGDAKPSAFCSDAKAIQHYLSSGGTVAFALDALVDRAEEKSPAGSEYRRKPSLEAEEAEFAKEVEALPSCVHDLDFDLVRRKIGLGERTGPAWFFLTDDEGDEDDSDLDDGDEAFYEGAKATAAPES